MEIFVFETKFKVFKMFWMFLGMIKNNLILQKKIFHEFEIQISKNSRNCLAVTLN